MKRILFALTLIFAAVSAHAQRAVMADQNGIIAWPTNFFASNQVPAANITGTIPLSVLSPATNWVAQNFTRTNTLANPFGVYTNVCLLAGPASYEDGVSGSNSWLGGWVNYMRTNLLAPNVNITVYSNWAICGQDDWECSNRLAGAAFPAIAQAAAISTNTLVIYIHGSSLINSANGYYGGDTTAGHPASLTVPEITAMVTNCAQRVRACAMVTNNMAACLVIGIMPHGINGFITGPYRDTRESLRSKLINASNTFDLIFDWGPYMTDPSDTNQFAADGQHPAVNMQKLGANVVAGGISKWCRHEPLPAVPGAYGTFNGKYLFADNATIKALIWSNNVSETPNLVIDSARSGYGLNIVEVGSGYANPEIWRIQEYLPGLCTNKWTQRIVTTGSGAANHWLETHYRLTPSPFTDTTVYYADGLGNFTITSNAFIKGIVASTNGFGSGATNTYSITATGYTNATGIIIRIVGLTGTSIIQSNSAIPLIFSRGTITTPTDVILQPRESITGSSIAAQSMQAF